MRKNIKEIVDESIRLELNVSKLYKIFNQSFKEDAYFWWELSEEEKNHANLIRKIGGLDYLTNKLIEEILPEKLDNMIESNKNISEKRN